MPTVAPAPIPVGNRPVAVGIDTVRNLVYVANWNSGNVTVINGANDNIRATVPAGRVPSGIDHVDVGGNSRVYVSNYASNNVTVIDGRTDQAIATIPVGSNPTSVAASPVTNANPLPLVFVTNGSDNTLSVIDATSNTALTPVPLTGKFPTAVAVNRRTNLIYVATAASDSVQVIDGRAFSQIRTFPYKATITGVPGGIALAVDESRNRIYVANAPGGLTVIEGALNQAIVRVPVGPAPNGVAYNPNTSHIFVTNAGNDTVSVLDASDLTKPPVTLRVGAAPRGVAVAPFNKIYVTNADGNNVSVIHDSVADPPPEPTGAGGCILAGVVMAAPAALARLGVTHLLRTQAGLVALQPADDPNQMALALTARLTRPVIVSGLPLGGRGPVVVVTAVRLQ